MLVMCGSAVMNWIGSLVGVSRLALSCHPLNVYVVSNSNPVCTRDGVVCPGSTGSVTNTSVCLLPLGQTKVAGPWYCCESTVNRAPAGSVEIVMVLRFDCAWRPRAVKQKKTERRNRFIDDTKSYIDSSTSDL